MVKTVETWGPWVEHDGEGCPASIIGRFVLLEIKLTSHDNMGGQPGQLVYNEEYVSEVFASIPEWFNENIGKIVECSIRKGELYCCPRILRYKVRNLASFNELLTIVENPVSQKELIEHD